MINRSAIDELIRKSLKEISQYKVSLDADPISTGVGTFNKKVAEAREFTNRVASILTSAILIKRQVQGARDQKKAHLEMELRHILGSDQRVYDVPEGQKSSVESRKARAATLLSETNPTIESDLASLEELFLSVSSFYDIVKVVYDNLNETRRDLLYQVSVVRTQIGLGEVQADPNLKNIILEEGPESQSGFVSI